MRWVSASHLMAYGLMPVIKTFRKWIVQHTKKSLIYISMIIFVLDAIFVVINYYSSKYTLSANLLQNAVEQQREFGLTMQMTYRNMMQMALYISQNKELNQLFLEGKQAVLAEGGGKGGAQANFARQRLLNKVKPAWDQLTKAFDIRQLHYHIGPGSLSFLRVHKPQKYGDRMDDLRFIIVDTNKEQTPRSGFETGRIYSGLRGVYPIFALDPKTGQRVHVGALETGTSYKQLLPAFAKFFDTNVAVLLTKQHIESKMWPEFIKEYFSKNPDINYYIEATSSKSAKIILSQIKISTDFISQQVQLIKMNDRYWSVYYFPLRDYVATRNSDLAPSGFVLLWSDATSLIHAFNDAFIVNIIYAFLAYVIVEISLIWFFTRERRIAKVEEEATLDGLTRIFSRGHFDKVYEQMFEDAKTSQSPLSIIMCDIDHFKQFNDTYGHQAGDDCLRRVVGQIRENIHRENESVARYGGEEFVVILPNTDERQALAVAEKIRRAVEKIGIRHSQSLVSENVTLSLGVATSHSCQSAKDLLKIADENLYRAKEKGRNRVEPSPS